MADITITDQPDAHRYVIAVDGEPSGLLAYRVADDVVTFTHAEIDPAHEGQGLGSLLAAYALDQTRARGRQAVPLCPFVHAYVEKHPEYADLVPEAQRRRFGLA